MEILDNINHLFGDNLKGTIQPDSKIKIAASCFSIYAYEALKTELQQIDSLQFIFTSPTFVSEQVSDNLKKEKREFHIPRLQREFEILEKKITKEIQFNRKVEINTGLKNLEREIAALKI